MTKHTPSPRPMVRFNGITDTAAEKKALQNVLDAFKAMGRVEPS
ncbi:hypothetical protein [Paenibacillus sp. 1011MAR3C5]|nr:hypothetical protein [Paenibacillus sp. 1011MAR3C5]